MQQQIIRAGAVTKNEQAKLLPGLTLGIYRQTFVGYQLVDGQDRYFGNNQFFGSVMAGITVPVLSAGQYRRVQVAKADEQIARSKYDATQQLLTSRRAAASNAYYRYLRAVQYYETTGLQNAATITTAANAQYRGGYINYMEWVLLINQAIAIRNEYTEALRQLNDATLTLNYFTN
jgi:cobalt-zinc-cadmium resistance protein CzcA